MTSSVADAAIVGLMGLAMALRLCRRGCHAKMLLPFPLPGKRVIQVWDAVEASGWVVVDPGSTLEVSGKTQTHQLARPGMNDSTFEQCEADQN